MCGGGGGGGAMGVSQDCNQPHVYTLVAMYWMQHNDRIQATDG